MMLLKYLGTQEEKLYVLPEKVLRIQCSDLVATKRSALHSKTFRA